MKKNPKKILLCGTHITPTIELINQLRDDDLFSWTIFFAGKKYNSTDPSQFSTEYKMMTELNIKFFEINSPKYDRHNKLLSLFLLPKIIFSVFSSIQFLQQTKPDICISFGGYTSVPVIIATKLLSIPSIVHEQTSTISLSTKISSHFTTFVALSFPAPYQNKKFFVTGNLLRREILTPPKKFPLLQYFKQKRPLIFITAGNQGSTVINKVILHSLPWLTKSYNVIHQTGAKDFPNIQTSTSQYKSHYLCFDYKSGAEFAQCLHSADIIVCRSGANTAHEVVALGKKTIFIPLPTAQQDEQQKNAEYSKSQLPDLITILPQHQLTDENLKTSIEKLSSTNSRTKVPVFTPNLKLLQLIHENCS